MRVLLAAAACLMACAKPSPAQAVFPTTFGHGGPLTTFSRDGAPITLELDTLGSRLRFPFLPGRCYVVVAANREPLLGSLEAPLCPMHRFDSIEGAIFGHRRVEAQVYSRPATHRAAPPERDAELATAAVKLSGMLPEAAAIDVAEGVGGEPQGEATLAPHPPAPRPELWADLAPGRCYALVTAGPTGTHVTEPYCPDRREQRSLAGGFSEVERPVWRTADVTRARLFAGPRPTP